MNFFLVENGEKKFILSYLYKVSESAQRNVFTKEPNVQQVELGIAIVKQLEKLNLGRLECV